MKKSLFTLLGIFFIGSVYTQEQQILSLTSEQIEALFLQQNLQLIAEKMNVDIADAAIAQAKLWDNPELSIGEVGFWSTEKQRKGETVPPLFSSSGQNTQFTVELSQMILTANKRGKRVGMEKTSKEIVIQEFEETLWGLKTELRKLIHELLYLQSYKEVILNQAQSIELLIAAYKKQVEQGNIAKTELLRLQSEYLELENEKNEISISLNEQQKWLKSLLNATPTVTIRIDDDGTVAGESKLLSLQELLQTAIDSRPDVKRSDLQTQYFKKTLSYEKAMRAPDITLNAAYNRYGGEWKNFVGFGLSFDLPLLNRNQGNIRAAKIGIDQSNYLFQQHKNSVQHEVVEAYQNYTQAYDFYQKISQNELLSELDQMLDSYTKNLLNRNVSMLEYLDFLNAYKMNKQTLLTSYKNVTAFWDELQYIIGREIK